MFRQNRKEVYFKKGIPSLAGVRASCTRALRPATSGVAAGREELGFFLEKASMDECTAGTTSWNKGCLMNSVNLFKPIYEKGDQF